MKLNKISQKNEPISALLHLIGLICSVIGFVFLMIFTKEHGTIQHLIGFLFFGISLILLYSVSTVYHLFSKLSIFKKKLRQIDHIMIYIFMASTYTPICLTIDNRVCGWGLLIVTWGFAITGVILKKTGVKIREWVSVLMYVVLGLLILSAIGPVLHWLPKDGVGFLYGGGSLYLAGVVFYILEEYGPKVQHMFGFHEIWHLFVMAGSFSHAWLMIRYVLYV